MASLLFALLGVPCVLRHCSAQTIVLEPPLEPPDGASLVVDPSFAGFGIEPSNLFSFTGYESPNRLTRNLFDNLANYTGHPANVRIGGNTQDYMVYSGTQLEWTWVTNPAAIEGNEFASNHMLIGPHFYDAIDRLPQGTPVTYGINMAYQEDDYAQTLSTLMQQAIERLKNVHLVSFELGNEPDLWLQNGFRTGEWNGQVYTKQWLDRAAMLCQRVLIPSEMHCNMFEPGATASTIGTNFQIKDLVSFGITETAPNAASSYVAQWNQHDYYYFLGVSDYTLTLSKFMTLSSTRDQFRAWEEQISQARSTEHRYALREMGIVGPIGLEGITNTFGAALWTLNFFFYAATLNITNIGMHMTDNSNASAWQPIEMYGRDPFIRPIYYAFAAFDQIIGPTCQAQIAEVDLGQIPSGYVGHVEAYTVHQNRQLASIVIINAQVANESLISKPSLSVELVMPSEYAGQTLYLAYLSSAGADATSGTTWNGLTFEQNGDGTISDIADEGRVITIGDDGKASFTVRDSEAIVAQVGAAVGELEQNQTACEQLKGSLGGQNGQASTNAAGRAGGRSNWSSSSSAAGTVKGVLNTFALSILCTFLINLGFGL